MHIPDNYLSPSTCAVMTAAVIPAWVHSVKQVRINIPREKMVLLGVGAAFSFLGMMFNIPMIGGTTGHAVGGTLIALLLGPEAACIAVTIALLVQALLFGDGGILAFGANCFNMAFVLPYVGYYSYLLFRRILGINRRNFAAQLDGQYIAAYTKGFSASAKGRDLVAAGLGSYLGINMAALMAAIEFGIQPLLFVSESGTPLYCPYGLSISVPAMMIGHLTVFGAAEVIFTVAIYGFLSAGEVSQDSRAAGRDFGEVSQAAGNISQAAGEVSQDSRAAERGFGEVSQDSRMAERGFGEVSQVVGKPSPLASSRSGFGSRRSIALMLVLIIATPLGLLAAGTAWGEWDIAEMPTMSESFRWESIAPDYSFGGLPEIFGYILSAVIGVSLLIIIFRLIAGARRKYVDYD